MLINKLITELNGVVYNVKVTVTKLNSEDHHMKY